MARRRRLPIRTPIYGRTAAASGSVPEWKLPTGGEPEWVTPYGNGLALRDDARMQLPNGLWLLVEVRDGRPQLVAIESPDSSHPITRDALQFKIETEVKTLIRKLSVRIVRDPDTGEEYGVPVTASTGPGETRSIAERTQDVGRAAGERKPGRPALTDDFLLEVVREWGAAERSGGTASSELAALYSVEPATIRQWMFKARKRGLAPKGEEDG